MHNLLFIDIYTFLVAIYEHRCIDNKSYIYFAFGFSQLLRLLLVILEAWFLLYGLNTMKCIDDIKIFSLKMYLNRCRGIGALIILYGRLLFTNRLYLL